MSTNVIIVDALGEIWPLDYWRCLARLKRVQINKKWNNQEIVKNIVSNLRIKLI